MKLRPATPEDLELLRYWDEQPHIIASDPDTDWEWETELLNTPEWREQLIAEVNDKPIGFIQIIDPALEETHYWGEVENNLRAIDIWIGEVDYIGKGYGTKIMRMALKHCFGVPEVTAVLIDPLISNTRAHRFYERCGFKFLEYRNFDGDECKVYQLTRANFKLNGS